MKYLGNFHNNFSNAVGSQDKSLQQDILLDKYAVLIKQYPSQVAEALKKADVHVASNPTTVELVDKVAHNIHTNPEFQHNISVLVTKDTANEISPDFASTYYFKMMGESYSNTSDIDKDTDALNKFIQGVKDVVKKGGSTGGSTTTSTTRKSSTKSSGGGGGGDAAGIITAVSGLTSSIFNYSAANKGLQASEANARASMYEKIFGQQKSKSWVLPAVIIGGILIIGGIVAYVTLRKK